MQLGRQRLVKASGAQQENNAGTLLQVNYGLNLAN